MIKTTKIVLLGLLAAMIGYDVFAYVEPTDGDTFSEVILAGSEKWPALTWAFGAFVGHLFWPSEADRSTKAKFAGLGGLVAGAGALTFAGDFDVHPLVLLVTGIVSGHLAWPQTPKAGTDAG